MSFSLDYARKIEEILKVIAIKTQDPELLPDFKAIRAKIKVPVISMFEYDRALKNLVEQVHIKIKRYNKLFYDKQ